MIMTSSRLPQGSESYWAHDVSHVYTHLKVAIVLKYADPALCRSQKDRIS